MTGWTRLDLPADITVHAGDFASQPVVFAHLLDDCPALDLTHVEAIQGEPLARLCARFAPEIADEIATRTACWNTIVLILPAAHAELDSPVKSTDRLPRLGIWRGRVPHMVQDRGAS